MADRRLRKRTHRPGPGLVGIPIGDLERIRDLNRKCAGWVDEWDFVRDAVRRRLEELGQKYPLSR